MLQTWHWSVKNRMSPLVCAQAWTLRPMGPMLLLWRRGRTKEHLSSPWRYVVKKSAWQTGQNGVCKKTPRKRMDFWDFLRPRNFGTQRISVGCSLIRWCFMTKGSVSGWHLPVHFFPCVSWCMWDECFVQGVDHSKNQGLQVMWFSRE